MMNEDKLCLSGDLAKQFMKNRVGDRVKLTVDAVLTGVEMRPDYGDMPFPKNGKQKEPPKKPYVEFVLRSINGKSGKPLDDMSNEEMESEIAKAKEGGDTYEEPDDAA